MELIVETTKSPVICYIFQLMHIAKLCWYSSFLQFTTPNFESSANFSMLIFTHHFVIHLYKIIITHASYEYCTLNTEYRYTNNSIRIWVCCALIWKFQYHPNLNVNNNSFRTTNTIFISLNCEPFGSWICSIFQHTTYSRKIAPKKRIEVDSRFRIWLPQSFYELLLYVICFKLVECRFSFDDVINVWQ